MQVPSPWHDIPVAGYCVLRRMNNVSYWNSSDYNWCTYGDTDTGAGLFIFTIAEALISFHLNLFILTRSLTHDVAFLVKMLTIFDLIDAVSTIVFMVWSSQACNLSYRRIIAGTVFLTFAWTGSVLVSFHISLSRLVGVVRAVNLLRTPSPSKSRNTIVTASSVVIALLNCSLCVLCDIDCTDSSNMLEHTCAFLNLFMYTFHFLMLVSLVLYIVSIGLLIHHGATVFQGKRTKLAASILFYVVANALRMWLLSTIYLGSKLLRFDITPLISNPLFAYVMSNVIQEIVHDFLRTPCQNVAQISTLSVPTSSCAGREIERF